jgi:hypothetical protein
VLRQGEGLDNYVSITGILGNGELLIVATVIAAAVIGDLLFGLPHADPRTRTRNASLSACALLVVVVSVLAYGELANRTPLEAESAALVPAVISVIMFLTSCSIGVVTILWSAARQGNAESKDYSFLD